MAVLAPHLDSEVGRPRQLSLEGFLVALQLNALHRHHRAHLVQAAASAQRPHRRPARQPVDPRLGPRRGLSPRRAALSSPVRRARVRRRWRRCDLVRQPFGARRHPEGRAHQPVGGGRRNGRRDLGCAPGVRRIPSSSTGRLPRRRSSKASRRTHRRRPRSAPPRCSASDPTAVSATPLTPTPGPDTAPPKATAAAGPYVGYELHLAVQTRDVRWTNYIDRTTLGPEVPGVITTCVLAPAGSHRGDAIVEALIASNDEVHPISDVVWDPGYSLCQPETTTYPLTQAGIEQTLELVTHQRGIRPFAGDALLLDGQLYSPMLPSELRDLKSPPRFARGAYRRAYEDKFNRRARWRMVRHSAPDADGVTRWRCPFCAGLLRSRSFPRTMRRSRTAPLVDVGETVSRCCGGTLSAPPAELPLTQKIPFGTTAWRISMYRRQVVESVNAALKGSFADLSRGSSACSGGRRSPCCWASPWPRSTSTACAVSGPSRPRKRPNPVAEPSGALGRGVTVSPRRLRLSRSMRRVLRARSSREDSSRGETGVLQRARRREGI